MSEDTKNYPSSTITEYISTVCMCVLSTSIPILFNRCLCVRHSRWKACMDFSIHDWLGSVRTAWGTYLSAH